MNNRQNILIEELNTNGYISVVEASEKLNVTEMTIRRDFNFLEEQGLIIRVHGGAAPRSPVPNGIDVMMQKPRPAQRAIAKETVKTLSAGQTVMLNVGTTVLQIAKEIASSRIPLTVVTNSMLCAIALYKSQSQVLLLGGSIRKESLDLLGPITENNLDAYHVDVLISGCDGANSTDGFFSSDINLSALEQKAVKIADKVIIVTESHKFSKKSFSKFATIQDVSLLISDEKLSNIDKTNLQNNNTEILIAKG